ncbi:MAG: ribosomal-processing cysteine protease Prp [Spirochaetales bacterium]|nr:ribosomal-processing cysteine protease Prp [Spirochaetales bacterium]
MTTVELVCDGDGCIKRCNASGHAAFSHKGGDIVCAAESILFNTVLELLMETSGVVLETDKSSRGNLAFSVEEKGSGNTERLKCMADFLRCGLKSISEQYPEHVLLREKTED